MQTQIIKLSGLTCAACKKITEKRINQLDGVKKVETNIQEGIVQIETDREIAVKEIQEILKDTSYEVIEKSYV